MTKGSDMKQRYSRVLRRPEIHHSSRASLTAVALVLVVVLGGCANDPYEPKPIVTKLEKGTIITTTASLRNSFIHDPNDTAVICAEPSPDSSFTQNQSGSVTIALINSGGNDAASEDEGSAEEEMAGRVPSLLLARELLFRLCEFARNHSLDQATVLDLYKQNLGIIKNVSNTVAGNTEIKISDSISTQTQIGVSESSAAVKSDSGGAEKSTTAQFSPDDKKAICDDPDYSSLDACQ